LLAVAQVDLDRELWRLAAHPSDWGEIRVERPSLHLVLTAEGSNLQDVLGVPLGQRRPAPGSAAAPRRAPRIARKLDLRIADASVVWKTPEAAREWSVDGVNLAIGLRPTWAATSGSPEVLIERGMVLDHCKLSPGMCNDVLKYVAPILSKVTRAKGEISIDLDDWRLPLGHPEQGELGGRLALHEVEVGPGSFVRALAEALHVPPDVALARESIVRFELVDGRIRHRDLEFDLPGAHVRTSGSVGFDRTLDLLAEVELRLPAKLLAESPLARSLAEKTLKIPIGGTLARPRLAAGFVRELGLTALFDKLKGLGVKLPGGKAADDSAPDQDGGKLISAETAELLEDLLGKWNERRREKRAAADGDAPQSDQNPGVEGEAARKRPLDRLRDRLRRSKKPAEEPKEP
jgi:hypothetical protein